MLECSKLVLDGNFSLMNHAVECTILTLMFIFAQGYLLKLSNPVFVRKHKFWKYVPASPCTLSSIFYNRIVHKVVLFLPRTRVTFRDNSFLLCSLPAIKHGQFIHLYTTGTIWDNVIYLSNSLGSCQRKTRENWSPSCGHTSPCLELGRTWDSHLRS